MTKKNYTFFNQIKGSLCYNCEFYTNKSFERCSQCTRKEQLDYLTSLIDALENGEQMPQEGCSCCTTKKNKTKEILYDTGRGGFSIAKYCPSCGKKLE